MPRRLAAIILIAAALVALVSASAPPALAQEDKALTDLKALFEKDPAAGFVEAQRLFEKPKAEGDLAGMLGVLAIVRVWSASCYYPAPCLVMSEVALPVALARGDWAAVGDIRWTQASPVTGAAFLRVQVVAQMASDAYAKAGKEPAGFTEWKGRVAPYLPGQQALSALGRRQIATFPEECRPLAEAIMDAVESADDNRAAGLSVDLVTAASDAPTSVKVRVAGFVGDRLWLPGCERLLPTLRKWIVDAEKENPRDWASLTGAVMSGCGPGWSGRRDAYLETYNWCLKKLSNSRVPTALFFVSTLPFKMLRFGQPERVDETVRLLLDVPVPPDGAPYRWRLATSVMHPGMAAELRRRLVWEQLKSLDLGLRGGQSDILDALDTGFQFWRISEKAPESERAPWCLETAYQILDYASIFPTAESRSRAATEAAAYFTRAGRADLAAEATELAKSFAADDPKLRLQIALAVANAAGREGKWEDAVKGLEPVMAGVAASGDAVQGALLLQLAQSNLGKKDEAEKWLLKAGEILGQARVPASERVTYLMNIAGLTRDKTKKLALLKQADMAAAEAELEPLREKVGQQLAELALATGDLNTAETAFLDIIDRLEGKREALAFDRILRQQWFADNLRPYQRLLRVEAMRKDPGMALWIAETMRARALSDQMAWQKVDLQVAVAPEVRERLKALREMRTKTYALLQRAMGGEQLTGAEVRGAYLPIRGAYMPIRGPLLGDQALSEADLKELRGLLDSLAKEEAALASAVREQVPAYAEASGASVLTGTRLIEKVNAQKDLALLHYTLCDEGLVVVACSAGARAKVALIPVKGEELWQQIGKFRELIWERKPEANAEAAKLYNQLVLPVEGCFYGAKRVWIVADGALQLLPFGALIGTDGSYLSSKYAVATTPSLTMALSSRGKHEAGQGAVIVAAPDTGAMAFAETDDKRGAYMPIRGMYMPVRGAYMPIRGEGVSTALTAMASVPLPGAKAEGEALGKLLTTPTLLTDKQATKAKLLAEGSKCDLLHIATHGYADPDVPEFSGLLLAGEGDKQYDTLTALDIYMWPLKARLVTLSACQTALGKTVEGEGMMGLTRAFIYAGAQDVLCTLWPVADESTKTTW
ncbi:MAG: CHAT domain-containing protein [Armatimonadia bacterium]